MPAVLDVWSVCTGLPALVVDVAELPVSALAAHKCYCIIRLIYDSSISNVCYYTIHRDVDTHMIFNQFFVESWVGVI